MAHKIEADTKTNLPSRQTKPKEAQYPSSRWQESKRLQSLSSAPMDPSGLSRVKLYRYHRNRLFFLLFGELSNIEYFFTLFKYRFATLSLLLFML